MTDLLDQARETALTAAGLDETARATLYQQILHSFLDYPLEAEPLDESQLDLRLGSDAIYVLSDEGDQASFLHPGQS